MIYSTLLNNKLTGDHELFYKYILAYLSDDEEKDRRKQTPSSYLTQILPKITLDHLLSLTEFI